jgi:hypothetical protein
MQLFGLAKTLAEEMEKLSRAAKAGDNKQIILISRSIASLLAQVLQLSNEAAERCTDRRLSEVISSAIPGSVQTSRGADDAHTRNGREELCHAAENPDGSEGLLRRLRALLISSAGDHLGGGPDGQAAARKVRQDAHQQHGSLAAAFTLILNASTD